MTKDQRAQFLAKRFKIAAKKSCGATIEMAEIVAQAVRDLEGHPLAIFYESIGLDPASSTVRKLLKIHKASLRFKRHLNRLPNAWTTLYELALLKSDEFERLLASEALHPLATWDELEGALKRRRGQNGSEDDSRVTLPLRFNLSKLPPARQRAFVEELRELCRKFKVWHPSKACEATIESLVNSKHLVPNGTRKAERVAGAAM